MRTSTSLLLRMIAELPSLRKLKSTTAGIIRKSGKVFQCRRVARWQPRTAAPAQTHALPLTLPLFAFATQVFDSRVGGGSVQRLGAATVVLAGDRGRVASTCGSECG